MNVAVFRPLSLTGEHVFVIVTLLRIERLRRRGDNKEQQMHDVSSGDRH
jgi:hypothetical protein